MCTVVISRRPDHPWPLALAANRDERLDRAWDAPAAHWPGLPGLVGGRDRQDGSSWRPFNLVVADRRSAWLLVSEGDGAISARALPEGVTMITAIGLDDGGTARARHHLGRFRAAPHPTPERHAPWAANLAATDREAGAGPHGGLTITPTEGYGTVAASLLFLPARGEPVWLFAAGRAGEAPSAPVPLAPSPAPARD